MGAVRVVVGTRRPLAGWGRTRRPSLAMSPASALTTHSGPPKSFQASPWLVAPSLSRLRFNPGLEGLAPTGFWCAVGQILLMCFCRGRTLPVGRWAAKRLEPSGPGEEQVRLDRRAAIYLPWQNILSLSTPGKGRALAVRLKMARASYPAATPRMSSSLPMRGSQVSKVTWDRKALKESPVSQTSRSSTKLRPKVGRFSTSDSSAGPWSGGQ